MDLPPLLAAVEKDPSYQRMRRQRLLADTAWLLAASELVREMDAGLVLARRAFIQSDAFLALARACGGEARAWGEIAKLDA